MANEFDLPATLSGHWETAVGREMAAAYEQRSRSQLVMGHMTDMELANHIFMVSLHDIVEMIDAQTAAKERIRWLSVQLAIALSCQTQPEQTEIARLKKALERIARPLDCGCGPCTGQCRSAEALECEIDGRRDIASAALRGE